MSWETNLKNRQTMNWSEVLAPYNNQLHCLLLSPCDRGVIRNGGKRGAKHGPQALLAPLKKMTASPSLQRSNGVGFFSFDSGDTPLEEFSKLQQNQSRAFENIFKKTNSFKKICHIGGGHDHIYSLVAAYLRARQDEEVLILNIDAHLDTRTDDEVHSGTPFRQLTQEFSHRVQLCQVGIHNFANHPSNYEKVENMKVIPWTDKGHYLEEISKELTLHREKTLILSLDCDGLDGSYMSAVSAPNHRGLSQREFYQIFEACQNFWKKSEKPSFYGLYEFNPLFDDLTTRAARFLAASIYQFYE